MGNFIARAFVKIKNIETRTEVINTLWDIGLKQIGVALNQTKDCIQINQGFYQCKDDFWIVEKCDTLAIDCNYYANEDEDLAVKLFLELAQMTDTKISDSWTTFNKRTILHKIVHEEEDIRRANYLLNTYGESGRATPLELAEAVMRGDVKL